MAIQVRLGEIRMAIKWRRGRPGGCIGCSRYARASGRHPTKDPTSLWGSVRVIILPVSPSFLPVPKPSSTERALQRLNFVRKMLTSINLNANYDNDVLDRLVYTIKDTFRKWFLFGVVIAQVRKRDGSRS